MAADRNYQRRLQRFLADPEYGPALARLRGNAEQRVLGLIHANKGREARATVLEEDERRRETARASARRRLEKRAVDNEVKVHLEGGIPRFRINRDALEDGARLLSDAELRFTASATRDQLVAKARAAPRHLTPRGEDWNPYWYH